MANTSRKTALFGIEDWKNIYNTYNEAEFQNFNFETMRKTFVDYLQQHHPESFNDFTESSEFIALLDLMAFMGQSLSFRNDLNSRENFLDTAERRDSVTQLANLVGYTAKRNENASGYLQVRTISTTENIIDYNQNNLGGRIINWNDKTNPDWQEQFTTILNAILINSQKIGNPGHSNDIIGVKTDEYEINAVDGYLPVISFATNVNNINMDFEVTNGSSQGSDHIYEPAPATSGQMNILYRNDNLGFEGPNTGFFFCFKQGTLNSQDFTLSDRIANRNIDVTIPGVNNDDIWVYKINDGSESLWTKVENIYSTQPTQIEIENRKFYSVTSQVNDQITLNFGDDVFSTIPVGDFRTYARSSNGLEYVIEPSEMGGIEISIEYISKKGRKETATFALRLNEPVHNSKNKESLVDIKRRAPARYYTQNRMVNGEDCTNFPFAYYNSIIKSKAINRSSVGTSRYLDLVDPTGKFSSINTYGSDGILYQNTEERSFGFTFYDKNDIQSVITNQVEPMISNNATTHFYYDAFPRVSISVDLEMSWIRSSTFTNKSTGYFVNSTEMPMTLGPYTNDSREALVAGALVKFIPPPGTHFTSTNKIVQGIPVKSDDKMSIWAQISDVYLDGTNFGAGQLENNTGPVTVNNFVPTGAIPTSVISSFSTDLPLSLEQEMVDEISLYRDFGLGFDNTENRWYMIRYTNLDSGSDFSLDNAEDNTNYELDASWVIKFTSSGSSYSVVSRSLNYYFASVMETRFFYDNNGKIYDQLRGKNVNDYIKILKTNSKPDSHEALDSDISLDIIDQTVESDGYVNDFNVEVSYTDFDNDGVLDDPDFFKTFVNSDVNVNNKRVYFELTTDFDNLERYLPLATGDVNDEYPTESSILIVTPEYSTGTVFYAYSDNIFFELEIDGLSRILVERTDMKVELGRRDVYFQYKHHAPESRRINPGISNIIDVFVVTNAYYTEFVKYIQDTTSTITEPAIPTMDELFIEYERIQDFKMTSDNVILNSVKFKPLFGNKSDTAMQAYIKVVKLTNTNTSDSDIKSKVIYTINEYFDITIWDFGDTFYFSELSAYLHSKLGDVLASAVIVPKDPTKNFGELYEIRSQANEIFISSATVDDVQIIDALTANKIYNGVR